MTVNDRLVDWLLPGLRTATVTMTKIAMEIQPYDVHVSPTPKSRVSDRYMGKS